MTSGDSNILVLNDHVSLPIIISDWDAIQDKKAEDSEDATHRSNRDSVTSVQTTSSTASEFHWKTGFGEFVDECWGRMTDGMKQKLRDACYEVLRRTDGAADGDMLAYDEDARLLD